MFADAQPRMPVQLATADVVRFSATVLAPRTSQEQATRAPAAAARFSVPGSVTRRLLLRWAQCAGVATRVPSSATERVLWASVGRANSVPPGQTAPPMTASPCSQTPTATDSETAPPPPVDVTGSERVWWATVRIVATPTRTHFRDKRNISRLPAIAGTITTTAMA